MADIKEARKILAELPASDAFKCVDELTHWQASVVAEEGFKPEHKSELVRLLDDAGQAHLRKLGRDYLAASPRLAKFQEMRLWTAMHEYCRQTAAAYCACIDVYAGGAKRADAGKVELPLLLARALRALAAQLKWTYMRYGPIDQSLWGAMAKVLLLAQTRKLAQAPVQLYAGIESTPEQEFLKAVMLSVSSPASLLPLELELAERLLAHVAAAFGLHAEPQPGAAYWIDLAAGSAPVRLARAPQATPGLRYIACAKALEDLRVLAATIKGTGVVPAQVNLGGSYPAETVLEVLGHLTLYLSPQAPERKHPRHRVKSRLNVTHGYDGVLSALGNGGDAGATESWIVDNVSAGGFGASIPEIRGDWLKIGCLLGLQPEGGDNWVLGVIRRLQREVPQKGSVGIQTIAKSAQTVNLKPVGAAAAETGILLSDASDAPGEVRVLLHAGAYVPGQNMEYEMGGQSCLLMPQALLAGGEEYELVKCRALVREHGE